MNSNVVVTPIDALYHDEYMFYRRRYKERRAIQEATRSLDSVLNRFHNRDPHGKSLLCMHHFTYKQLKRYLASCVIGAVIKATWDLQDRDTVLEIDFVDEVLQQIPYMVEMDFESIEMEFTDTLLSDGEWKKVLRNRVPYYEETLLRIASHHELQRLIVRTVDKYLV